MTPIWYVYLYSNLTILPEGHLLINLICSGQPNSSGLDNMIMLYQQLSDFQFLDYLHIFNQTHNILFSFQMYISTQNLINGSQYYTVGICSFN